MGNRGSRTGYVLTAAKVAALAAAAAAKDYAEIKMTLDKTLNLTVGNVIEFDQLVRGATNLTPDAAGIITLAAGKKYLVTLSLGVSFTSGAGLLGVDIYGYTLAAATLIPRVYITPDNNPSSIVRGPHLTKGIIEVPAGGADETIGMRITSAGGLNKIYNRLSGSFIIIQEL